jgi:sugar/nucleoside kinase (ribokinase family)
VSAPDFLAIGHVTLDRSPGGARPGGAALYAALTAHRLGLSAGLLTSHGVEFPLELLPPQIEVVTVEADATTVFHHQRQDGGRALRVTARARPLGVGDVPADWLDAPLVLLAPVLDEVDPALAHAFADATVAAAAQGWLRAVSPGGEVVPQKWTPPPELLTAVQVLFVSTEDIRGQEEQALEWVQRLPLAVITAAAAGALLYVNGDRFEVRPRPTTEVDDTGAGDVFATTFVIHYHRHGDPWEAAAAAACAASLAVEGPGWSSVPDAAALARALAAYREG